MNFGSCFFYDIYTQQINLPGNNTAMNAAQ